MVVEREVQEEKAAGDSTVYVKVSRGKKETAVTRDFLKKYISFAKA